MLNKTTQERIKKNAIEYAEEGNSVIGVAERMAYIEGATTEAEREQKLEEALEEIAEIVLEYHKENGNSPAANHCRNIAMAVLAKNRNNLK